jgi:protein-L-isoaspartate(D-aspartate) O-methyltransferase
MRGAVDCATLSFEVTPFAGTTMLEDRWRRALALCAALAVLLPGTVRALDEDDHVAWRRAEMTRVIERYAFNAVQALGRRRIDPRVLEVMGRTPRHLFVPEWLRGKAYEDRPLPIGYGQTISQPFIVALMTDLLAVGPEDVVLEVGTGSGYQAAVLAPLVRRVCTIEIIPELGRSAGQRLESLGHADVETRIGDGYYGWPECGPFDGIVVTAAAGQVPPPLVGQLKPGGRMVIPVGGPFTTQWLMLVEKLADGRVKTRQLLPVAFVPLTRRSP